MGGRQMIRSRSAEREKGVALVMVLGLLALIGAWASSSLSEDWLSLRQAENTMQATRAWMAAESGFELAGKILVDDARDNEIDHLNEDWAQPTPPYSVDEGSVSRNIVDANRFFNLNDLMDANGRRRDEAVAIARRLFAQVDLSARLVDALADWMDADHTPAGIGGAEDAAYSDRDYRVKNAPLDRMEELLLIEGFDADALAKLRQVAVVRPDNGMTPININTAPKEVLMSLADNIPASDIETIVGERDSSPFNKVTDLTSRAHFSAWAGKLNAAHLSVASDAFIVRSVARFERAKWGEEAMFLREGGKLKMLYRQRLAWTEM